MLKKFSIIIIMILLLVGLSGNVLAKDKYTATSTINGVTANWEYELNDSNQIENLKCTNASELTGNITIPNSLDDKIVVSVGNEAFKSATNITGVVVSNSIQSIGYGAFNGCTSLTSVNLGNITKLSFDVFKGCSSLTSITIPKTLKDGAVSPCLNNTNITSITLEEGLTIVPKNLCANTGITEITIPNSVTEIEYSAFDNCPNLKKITILDNVTKMGFYNIDSSESIFKNHNSDLTIYCYEDSMAAKYAIKYNIKYVYLPRHTSGTPSDDTKPDETKPDSSKPDSTPSTDTKPTQKDDTTIATGKLPQTGATMTGILVVLVISVASIIFYIKYRKFRDI